MQYRFFALLSRMRYIGRWGLMRNSFQENIQEHSHMVAVLAHGLATIQRDILGVPADPDRCAAAALFHDASEIFTGDLPTPIKYYNPAIKQAYKEIEAVSCRKLLSMLPPELQPSYAPLLEESEPESAVIVKAEAETRHKAQRAENAERVLLKAERRLSDTAYQPFCDVFPAPERVNKPFFGTPRHCIYRKIAAREVGNNVPDKADALRMSAVLYAAVGAEGGQFKGDSFKNRSHGAEFQAGINHFRKRRKKTLGFLRRGGNGEIDIVDGKNHQAVTDKAADGVRFDTGCRKYFKQAEGGVVRFNHFSPVPVIILCCSFPIYYIIREYRVQCQFQRLLQGKRYIHCVNWILRCRRSRATF